MPKKIAERRDRSFDLYHAALGPEVARLKARHGHVAVYDRHSIRSVVPRPSHGRIL